MPSNTQNQKTKTEDAYAYLLTLSRFSEKGRPAYRPGVKGIQALLRQMGQPQDAFVSVQVGGTNGKGTTASLIAAIASATGLRVGLHTSPHLYRVNERMRVDGVPVSDEWLAAAVARWRPLFDEVRPSFFEATLALSFLYFAEAAVDLAVVEVGLGGRLDATTILQPRLSVITSIGLDHADILGHTLPLIAREKAGIIKPGVPVVTSATQPEVLEVIQAVARRREAPCHVVQEEVRVSAVSTGIEGTKLDLYTPLRRYRDLFVALPGKHQQHNTTAAVRGAELLFEAVQSVSAAVYVGCARVRTLAGLRGRLEVVQPSPLIVADVGHNPEGLAVALDFMQAVLVGTGGRLHVLLGVMKDKDVHGMVSLLSQAGAITFPVYLESERALDVDTLAQVLINAGVATATPGTVAEGCTWFERQASPADALLVTGSHQVVAQVPDGVGGLVRPRWESPSI